MTKDPLCQETEKTSGQTHPSIHEITKPSAMFIEQVTIGNTTKQVAMVDEILGLKVLQPKNGHISFKKHYKLKKRPKMVTSVSAKTQMATAIATKSMSELIKKAWRAKARVAAQKTKNGQTAKKLQQPASSMPGILSFDDWRFKRMYERHNKTRDINNNSLKARTRSSDDLHCDEITNPTVMFTNQMVFEDILQQTTEAEEIMAQDVFRLEIDGTQLEDWDALMEEVIIDDLPPPLHFQRTSDGIQVGHDLPIYPPVPNDSYHGPTKTIDVQPSDWKEINLAREDEEPKIIKIGSQLTDKEVQQYKDLVLEFIDVFAWSYTDLKGMPPEIVQHTIPLFPDSKPIRQLQRRMNPRMQLIVKAVLEQLLQAGFIKPVEITNWVLPMVLVKKKNGKIRICIDYRALNKRTQKDHFPLPFIHIILDEVARHELYTFMDGYSGYNQISIAPEDHHKTAFITPWSTFIYIVMPFGLCNAPSAFQRAMSFAFSDLLHKSMTVFIDDFSTHSSTTEHLHWVRECLIRCCRTGITVNLDKLYLAVKKGILLGHIVSREGTEPDPAKVEAITELKPPTDVKGIQRVLGHIGWYRSRIKDYATTALPLTNLLRKESKFEWTPECQKGFDELKRQLTTYPVLRPLDWDQPWHVYYDASAVAVGSALCQPAKDGGRDHPIAFASKQLTDAERNYTTTEREALAMVFSVKKYRHFLLMNKVIFFVDHMALRYLVNKPDLSGRLARWILLLTEFDYTVQYKPGKMNLQADHLSRLSTETGTEEMDDEFPDGRLFAVQKVPLWYSYIAEFLSTQAFPANLDRNERRKIQVNNTNFAIIANKLYQRGIDGILRWCVDYTKVPDILEACHDSACGEHFSGRLIGQKILRAGYYWPTLFANAEDYV